MKKILCFFIPLIIYAYDIGPLNQDIGPILSYSDDCTPPTISAGADRIDTAQVTDTITLALGGGTCDSVTGVSLPAWMTLTKTGANMGRLILAPTDSVDPADYIFIAHGCANDTDTVHITVTWGDVRLASVAPDTVWWGDTATILGRGFKNAQGTSTFAWGDSTPTMALWKNDTLKAICPQLTAGFYTFSACNGTMCDTLTTDSIYVAGPSITQFTLTITDDGHGSTVPATGDTTVDSGSVVAVSATPDAGYVFSRWTRSNTNVTIADSTLASTTATVGGNATATANFVKKQFAVTIAGSHAATVSPYTGTQDVDSGDVLDLSATPDVGYDTLIWVLVGDGEFNIDSSQFTVTGVASLTATYRIKKFTITMASDGNGATDPAVGDHAYDSGTIVDVAGLPNAGYVFDHWVIAGTVSVNADSTRILVTGDASLLAIFAVKKFTLTTAASPDQGTVVPAAGDTLVDSAGVVPIGWGPAAGYVFLYWVASENVVLSGDSTTAEVRGDGTLTAVVGCLPPPFSYIIPVVVDTTGRRATHLNDYAGCTPVTFTINPALPAGLAINAGTGTISGTPTDTAEATPYNVTVTGAGGFQTAVIDLAVVRGVGSATKKFFFFFRGRGK